ncbi:hypothetical protein QAD02_007472 [Eretmocerus hayati]|uniref:Uncharacterized protein n=1 Tax=Eretmocerus hayati TaxID=131215 RepID=A0ACC2N3Q7_9HYME|nr:hypothetical protein QAD02_007472 [Eretmocerus hayati]
MRKVDEGFEVATSQNLPSVDFESFLDFLINNKKYISSEMRGVKTIRSARANYGDSAVGHVQLKRDDNICTVRALITPEHKIHQQPYSVTVIIDEEEDMVQEAVCHSCVASAGGCKHAVAVLAWLHRRSEEPASTSVQCYWKKSVLSKVGTTIKGMTLKDVYLEQIKNKAKIPEESVGDVFSKILEIGINKKCAGQLILNHKPLEPTYLMSLHHLSMSFRGNRSSCSQFLDHCREKMDEKFLLEAERETRDQSHNPLWYELKFGRIGGSLLYEAANCSTPDGSLVDRIMGSRIPDTPEMKRGRDLETEVLKVVKKNLDAL